MSQPKSCPRCFAYLLDHQNLKGWKACPGCGWACDEEGDNLVLKAARNAALDLLVEESERLGLYGDEFPTLCKRAESLDQPCQCNPECNPIRKD